MGDETSATSGQAPATSTPQAGTPASGTPATQAPQAGSGQAQPKYSFNSPEEVEAFATRLINDRRAANREAQQANSELAALKQQVEVLAAQSKAAQQRAIASDVQLQAKQLGFRKPEHVYSIIQAQLAYDANGQPTNTQAVLDALKVSDAYLLETPSAPTAAPSQPAAPQAPAQQQPRTGVMNAPRSAVTAGTLTWDEAMRVVKSPTEYARRMKEVDAFLANPANRPQK